MLSTTFDNVWSPVHETSVYDRRGSTMPLKLRENNWDLQFIDMGLLSKSTRELDSLAANGPMRALAIIDGKLFVYQPKQERSRLSIKQWTYAFVIYMGVLLEKLPTRSQELL
ncbi:hypothetical protein DPMN_073867 [Dreissena polymorpha]|uniref:Uncharacterized protein n=1 Tax=Dreissena polymorpha TaxID=45954 RepID=A0A9D3YEA5_DREPO|nr:hypothetical protein DPMN_073867 [Dreissena polymorpha]